MNNIRFSVTYYEGGKKYVIPSSENTHFKITYEMTDNAFKAKIFAKQKITLDKVSFIFDKKFEPGERFFGNGYQSWSTTMEYTSDMNMNDVTKLAVTKGLRKLAGISGDVRFVGFPKEKGRFFSHCYSYIRKDKVVDLFGSLSERQGFTVIYGDMNKDTITLTKDVEGVTIEGEYELCDMVRFVGSYDEVFDKYFEAMGIKEPKVKHMAGYTSWYNYFQNIDESTMLRDLNAMDRIKDSVSIFQIDDGYESAVGDWLEPNKEKFPKGMKYIADEIHAKGYMAGIWLAPFCAQTSSNLFKYHKNWFIKTKLGLPEMGVPNWGGAFTLDIYNEEVRSYIKNFFDVVLNQWGYDMVKLDFLYTQCLNPRNNKSRGQIMVEAMEFLRECCGDKLILGCGVPLGAAFGYVDACRIGNDVDLVYDGKFYNALHINNEIPSAKNSIINAVFRRHLDGRAFCNDPDVFFLRYSNLKFTMEQKKILASVNHTFGNVLFVSDNAEEYKDSDIEIIKEAFKKFDGQVINAELNGDVFTIETIEDGNKKNLDFDLEEGKIIRGQIF